MQSAYQRAILPTRSFIAACPTSKQLCGRRLDAFSICATLEPDGTIGNHSLQLHWTEPVSNVPSESLIEFRNVTPSKSEKTCQSSTWSKSTMDLPSSTATTDIFGSMNSISPQKSALNSSKPCSCSTTSPIKINQMVRMVAVELKVVFFEWPGMIVRKQITRELKNDLTILEVLQQLLRQSGIKIDTAMNSETVRLFRLKNVRKKRLRYEEVDYLQWRCALLAEMSNADSFEFLLDCTDADDQTEISSNSDLTGSDESEVSTQLNSSAN